jgi:hypothetical protein
MRLNEFSNDKKSLDEVSLGDYRNKALKQKAQSQMDIMFARSPEEREKNAATFDKRERGLNRLKARDDAARKSQQEKQLAADIAALPALKAEYESMKDEYKSLGGSNWQYADREQNLSDYERKARSMEGPMNNLWRKIQAAEKAQKEQGVAEAGNKPLEKSRFGTGDTRTPRDIKSQMQGASDEFVKSTADKKTGPFHSKVAKMQGKMAKSELRRRDRGVAEAQLDEFGVGRGFPETPKYKVGDTVNVRGYQGVGKIAFIKARNDVGVIFSEPEAGLKIRTTIDKLIPKQGVAEGYTVTRGIDRERYTERDGLEGPFSTKSGKVVYYDKVEGKYYDPETDFYIEYDDWRAMNEADGDVISFELSNERAYNHVMQKFGNFIDWQDEAMTIPRKFWDAVQELALSAGGEAVEYGTLDEGTDPNTQSHAEAFKSETNTMKPGTSKYVGRKGGKEVTAKKDEQGNVKFYHRDGIKGPLKQVVEGVATSLPMRDAVKLLRQYGADNFKTTTNELHFYKNGKPFSVDLVMNPDTTRSVTLSSLNSATRGLKGQGVTEVSDKLRNRYVARASDDYGMSNFAARASKGHPGLEDYSKEQEARAKKRAAGLSRALSDKRTGRVSETTSVTDYNPKSQGGTRAELLAKFAKSKSSEDAAAARRAGATQSELKAARDAEPVKESRGHSALRQAMESVDANQKKAKQVPSSEMPKKTSPVIGKEEKQHPFKGRAVGGSI